MRIAVIPARAGSKRIKNKNTRAFHGKPIIAYSIESALNSQLFDRVIVSTDNESIANIARQYGAEVPFLRPAELADDYTPTVPVVQHALNVLGVSDDVDVVCCIYATAPMLTAKTLKACFHQFINSSSQYDYGFPVTEFGYPVYRGFTLASDNQVSMLYPEENNTRTQDLPRTYHDAGQFYFGRTQAWIEGRPILSGYSLGMPIPRLLALDIDDETDWKVAELIFQAVSELDSDE